MKIIKEKNDFDIVDASIDKIINKSKLLPENIFNNEFKHFLFITFDEFFIKLFFNNIKKYLTQVGGKGFWLTVIDPDPKIYFFHHFGSFGTFEFSNLDGEDDYISALFDFPIDSPADALRFNSNCLFICSFDNDLAIYGSRDADIAICAFSNQRKMEIFKSIYGIDLLEDVRSAANYAFKNQSEIDQFCKNYS